MRGWCVRASARAPDHVGPQIRANQWDGTTSAAPQVGFEGTQYLRKELSLDEAAVKRWAQHWIAESFRALEAQVAKASGGRYCVGDAVSLADVCLVPQMYNARRFDCDLTPYPTLVRIDDGLRDQPAFARAAPESQPDAE